MTLRNHQTSSGKYSCPKLPYLDLALLREREHLLHSLRALDAELWPNRSCCSARGGWRAAVGLACSRLFVSSFTETALEWETMIELPHDSPGSNETYSIPKA